MKYMGDSTFWDEKFEARSNKMLEAETVIVENVSQFKGKSLLDIACGDGRNSMLFLRHGFKVTGIDFSKEGLNRLKNFAKDYQDKLDLVQLDLTDDNSLDDIAQFDNVIISHYRLNLKQLGDLKNIVKKNGLLLITGFSEHHLCDERIGKDDLIYQTDIDSLLEDFTIDMEKHTTDRRGAFVTFILKRL